MAEDGETKKLSWADVNLQMQLDDEEIEPSVLVGGKIPNKPVFSDPDEKAKFDASLNLDLSVVSQRSVIMKNVIFYKHIRRLYSAIYLHETTSK